MGGNNNKRPKQTYVADCLSQVINFVAGDAMTVGEVCGLGIGRLWAMLMHRLAV